MSTNGRCHSYEHAPGLTTLRLTIGGCQTNAEWCKIGFNGPEPGMMRLARSATHSFILLCGGRKEAVWLWKSLMRPTSRAMVGVCAIGHRHHRQQSKTRLKNSWKYTNNEIMYFNPAFNHNRKFSTHDWVTRYTTVSKQQKGKKTNKNQKKNIALHDRIKMSKSPKNPPQCASTGQDHEPSS